MIVIVFGSFNVLIGHGKNFTIFDFISCILFDALWVSNDGDSLIFFGVVVKHNFLFFIIREHSNL